MNEQEIEVIDFLKEQIEDSICALKQGLKKFSTGRANITMLDGIYVNCYGSSMPLHQCATLSATDPRLIIIKPWDKTILNDITKAIQLSSLGINPQNDGTIIRLPIPALDEERRKVLVKQAKQYGENTKISIRNHRREANESLKEIKKVSEDCMRTAIEKVQIVVDIAIKQVDKIISTKEKEILEV